jgi:hypothetical protein
MRARFVRWLIVWLGLCLIAQPVFAQRSKRQKRSSQRSGAPARSKPAPVEAPRSSGDDDSLNDLDISEDTTPAPRPAARDTTPLRASEPEPVAGPAPEPAPEQPAEPVTEPAASDPAEPPPDEPAAGPKLVADVFVGAGIGSRSFQRPTRVGGQAMEDQFFPAAEVGLQMRAWPEESFSLYVLLRYQTSLGLVVEEQPLFALPNRVDVRADRGELSVAPVFRLGNSTHSPRLAVPVGMTLRSFWPALHNLMTPRYTMWGPHARIELHVPIGGIFTVRVAPEFQWIAHYSSWLTDSTVSSMGIALGGEASLRLALGSVFGVEISYRQSTAMANVAYGPTFRDVERFLTARVNGTL